MSGYLPDSPTALVLMKGTETSATIAALRAGPGGDTLTFRDEGPFWKINAPGDIHVTMEAVEEELGEPIALSRWLVSMSSFVGKVRTGEDWFTVMSPWSQETDGT